LFKQFVGVVHRSRIVGLAVATLLVASSCGEPRATAPNSPSTQLLNAGPTLLECPSNETAATIGLVDNLLGGAIQLGATNITIPSGALLSPQLFELSIPAGRFMEVDVNAVGFDSFLFETPVTITIDYSRCNRNLDGATLHVWHIDPITKTPLDDMGGVTDPVAQTITFTTGHLSGYAVAN
jgi:hypothetical protein